MPASCAERLVKQIAYYRAQRPRENERSPEQYGAGYAGPAERDKKKRQKRAEDHGTTHITKTCCYDRRNPGVIDPLTTQFSSGRS